MTYSFYVLLAIMIALGGFLAVLILKLGKDRAQALNDWWKAIERVTLYGDLLKVAERQRDNYKELAEVTARQLHLALKHPEFEYTACPMESCNSRKQIAALIEKMTIESIEADDAEEQNDPIS